MVRQAKKRWRACQKPPPGGDSSDDVTLICPDHHRARECVRLLKPLLPAARFVCAAWSQSHEDSDHTFFFFFSRSCTAGATLPGYLLKKKKTDQAARNACAAGRATSSACGGGSPASARPISPAKWCRANLPATTTDAGSPCRTFPRENEILLQLLAQGYLLQEKGNHCLTHFDQLGIVATVDTHYPPHSGQKSSTFVRARRL